MSSAELIIVAAGCAVRIFSNPETGRPAEVRVGWAGDEFDPLEHMTRDELDSAAYVYVNGVTVKDTRGATARMQAEAREIIWPTSPAPAPPEPERCPECGKKLRRRKGSRGTFVGCSGYPSCLFTSNDLDLVPA